MTPAGSLAVDISWKNLEAKPRDGSEHIFADSLGRKLRVQYFRPQKDILYRPHVLGEYTILVCIEGRLEKTEQGRTNIIEPGGTVVSNASVEHTLNYLSGPTRTCEALCVSFDDKVLAGLASEFSWLTTDQDCGLAFIGDFQDKITHNCALDIVQELRRAEAGHKKFVEIRSTLLLFNVLRSWPRQQIKPVPANIIPRLSRRDFIRAHDFMHGCRKEMFRLRSLCRFLGTSQERFNRLFLGSTGDTPANFYNRMLLERGRDLLDGQKLSIKEISFELGFKTTSHFGVAFRREFSVSPQEYRHRKYSGSPAAASPNNLIRCDCV